MIGGSVAVRSDMAVLAPVPVGLLEQGVRVCETKGKVAFGSRAWEFFRWLDEQRQGDDVLVYFYASKTESLNRAVTWTGRYVRHVEGVDGNHPEGRRYRSELALQDGSGWWAVFWEVKDLRAIEPIPIGDLRARNGGTNYATSFVPEGPMLIDRP